MKHCTFFLFVSKVIIVLNSLVLVSLLSVDDTLQYVATHFILPCYLVLSCPVLHFLIFFSLYSHLVSLLLSSLIHPTQIPETPNPGYLLVFLLLWTAALSVCCTRNRTPAAARSVTRTSHPVVQLHALPAPYLGATSPLLTPAAGTNSWIAS